MVIPLNLQSQAKEKHFSKMKGHFQTIGLFDVYE